MKRTEAFIYIGLAVIFAEIMLLLGIHVIRAHAETLPQANAITIVEAPPLKQETEPQQFTITVVKTVENSTKNDDGFVFLEELPLSEGQQHLLYTLWTEAGHSYPRALALIDRETGGRFNADAINHNTHDYGLFQLNRKSWLGSFKRMFGVSSMDEMLDLELNIKGALYVYGDCVDRYGETEKALVAYNRGFADYSSTKYSRDVLAKEAKWAARLEEAKHEGTD
ncbi:MAG: transglycosylase SLT domain-containing protein [Oscillospiraceae bacterium]|nr:transglycosylase SLT domain-containing protein [Oscillospiraceae bacterium]